MARTFTAYVEFDPDTKLYVGIIPGLPGAHSQGSTLDELHQNLREVTALILEEKAARGEPVDVEPFVGIQQIVVDGLVGCRSSMHRRLKVIGILRNKCGE